MANPEKLSCISIVICDDIYRDETTKKLIVVGMFNSIIAQSVPCIHERMHVLFSLTNGRGDYDLSLSIEHEKTGAVVSEVKGPFHVDDPLAIGDINMELHRLVFPKEGKYWVTIKTDGEILQQRPFALSLRRLEEAAHDHGV